jgi:NtrC-family two-component system sensor histidine kinase KinB
VSLRKKLLLTLAVPGVLLLAVGLAAIFSLNHLAQTADTILADNYRSIREARRMQEALLGLGGALPEQERATQSEELAEAFENALRACENNITEPEEPKLLQALRSEWNASRSNLSSAHISILSEKVSRLITLNEEAMYGHRQHTRDVARVLTFVLVIVVGLTVVALIGFSLLAARRISWPISEAANNLNRILASSRARDDIGASNAGEIERLQAEVRNLLGRVSRHEAEQESKLSALRQRLTAVMEEMRDGIVLVDSDLVFQACNRIGNRILGFEGTEARDQTLRQVLEREELRPAFEGFLQTRPAGSQDLAEVKIAADDGERVYRPHVTPITGDGSEPDGYLIVFWDATEHFELEESRRRFIAMLSHQLKTPLTSLTLSVNLMAERFSGENEEADELLTVARDDCRSFGELINELIQAAKDTSSGMRLHFHRVDLPRLLRVSLKPLVGQAKEKGVEFVDRLGESRFFATVDPVKFPWVVTNIVGNALRYTPESGTVTVELEQTAERATLVISDTGCGIAEEDVKKLFLPYVTLGTDEPTGRHGLGLTIAKEIVEAHNGELSVESRPGEGTRFIITFTTEEHSQT